MLDAQGPIGVADTTILIDSVLIMLAIVLPTIGVTIGFAWWFRASNTKARYLPTWAYSGRLELLVWAIPLLTITLLGGVAWIGSHALDPARPLDSPAKALEVQVVSLDWKWLFIYPEQHVASVNALTIPAGVPVHFALTSGSVMTTFFIPQLGSMIYTMNGMTSQLYLQADKPGTFRGMAAHFSGDGFSDMHFDVSAVPAGDFDHWVDTTRATGGRLDAGSYAELGKPSQAVAPFTYRDVDPDLFGKIATQAVPAFPGGSIEAAAGTNPGGKEP